MTNYEKFNGQTIDEYLEQRRGGPIVPDPYPITLEELKAHWRYLDGIKYGSITRPESIELSCVPYP